MRSKIIAFIAVGSIAAGVAQELKQDFGAPFELIEPFNSYVTVYDENNVEPLRPDIFGTHGVIATGNYAATMIGIEEFKKGGNAFDVGVAAAMAVKATTFDIAGWTGVAPLILYSAEEDRVVTRIGAGTAPAAATLENYIAHGKDPAHSVIVPADVDVWLAALDRYGTKSFEDVAQYTLDIAENGFHLHHRLKSPWANIEASATFAAFSLGDNVYHPLISGDSFNRTVPETNTAALAFVGQDIIRNQLQTG